MILIAQKVQGFIQNYESPAVNIIKSSDQMRRNCLFLSTCLGAFLNNLCPRCSSGYFGNLPHLYSAHFLFSPFFPVCSPVVCCCTSGPLPWGSVPVCQLLFPTGGCSLWPHGHGSSPPGRQGGRRSPEHIIHMSHIT